MGRRDSAKTVSAVLLAFLAQREWRQSDLAAHVGVSRKTLVRTLQDLQEERFPLERSEEPPHVYWCVPNSWFPGAVAFHGPDVVTLVRQLQRAPRSRDRERLLRTVASAATGVRISSEANGIVTRELEPEEEANLATLEESVEKRTVLVAKYHTLSRNDVTSRRFSVQRIFVDKGRFLAFCHRSERVKWFRIDCVLSARLDPLEGFRLASSEELDRIERESIDGFHSGDAPTRCAFRVRLPEARWFRMQLRDPFEVVEHEDEFVFKITTSGMKALARAVVGLGEAARVDTPELARLVREVAQAVLYEG